MTQVIAMGGPSEDRVYYLASRDFTTIKIGHSVSPRGRADELDLIYIASEPGGRSLERRRHERFAAGRVGRTEHFWGSYDPLIVHITALLDPADRKAHDILRRVILEGRQRRGEAA